VILKRGGGKKYGLTYQGSKAKIIDQIAKFFPNADNFYDLFGGGFSVTHWMMENRSKSYKNFYFNEIRPGICDLVKDAISGKYNYEVFKPEWISRERFLKEKDQNAYIKIIWSFGNNGENYLFGKEIESEKRSMHQAVIFDEFDDWFIKTFEFDRWPNHLDFTGKRLYLRMVCRKLKNKYGGKAANIRQQLERLEQLERLQQLQQLQQLERLHLTILDYKQVQIKSNSVIYCDIPYKGTADYGSTFNHTEFFDWADNQKNPVFISEYDVDDHRFYLLKKFTHRSTFSSGGSKNIPVVEKLYGNKIANEIIQRARMIKSESNHSNPNHALDIINHG